MRRISRQTASAANGVSDDGATAIHPTILARGKPILFSYEIETPEHGKKTLEFYASGKTVDVSLRQSGVGELWLPLSRIAIETLQWELSLYLDET